MSDPERARADAEASAEAVVRARIRAGDRDAFAEVYDAYARAVYNHAYRLTGDWSTAEEVMADTFLDAWRTRERLEPDGGSLKPWLLGMATNKARNAARGRGRRLAFLARRPAPEPVADFADETAGRLDDARRLAAVRQVYGRLRRAEREVLALCVWSGLDYGQAAEALGVPVGTVRSRLSRARARLGRLTDERLREERTRNMTNGGEPGRRRGEVGGEAAFAALPLKEIQEGSR
ncbi:RNA polymerase sigma factor [Streptomyces deccanensis]|uniref:RNA polymerase sigma factor n=1 Tax=Streptomyces deccanensis TaxID=424188 RepID=UPI001EFBCFFE|nr:RNA polymerase sigma factor [Streptomyces deccanensis]ULR53114.1 RNA polymerase sigma factor [Streptomyces deccanensis]